MQLRRLTLLLCLTLILSHVGDVLATTQTFVVTTTANTSPVTPGSLTWAMYQSNYGTGDVNHITFNIPGVTSETELVLSETLYLARPVVIDATTQPGYAGKPLIRINCNKLDSGFCVVPVGNGLPGGGGSTIKGMRIFNYNSNAITLFQGADGNTIANNYIGFAPMPDGSVFRNTTNNPTCRGIGIASNNNKITGNTVSGVDNGITVGFDIGLTSPPLCTGNTFDHNFVGTDPTGMTKIGNTSDGIFLGAGAQNNVIGPGNVLSGMASSGAELLHPTATNNRIYGNMIGLNAAGTDVIPNGELGILIANGASNNWIGGPYGGTYPGNVIAGNTLGAISLGTNMFPIPSSNNHIEGNFIGTDAGETKVLGSEVSGITLQNSATGNIIRKNVIVGQVNHGVVLAGGASTNAMYGNWIGVTDKGAVLANGGFGAYLQDASYNTVQVSAANAGVGTEQNVFGSDVAGIAGVYGNSVGNIIDLTQTATRLLNISTRMRVDTGDNALIAGFIITGNAPKKVLVRGLGTSLHVTGALADPTLELDGNGVVITNDDWKATQAAEITATGIPPTSDLESAIIATVQPGGYTAILRGKNNTSGVGLVEVYDLDSTPAVNVVNISTRGGVETGDNVMIAGFILGGGQTQPRVAVRALGASLAASGVTNPLQDPMLQLVNSNGALVQGNDDWQADPNQASQLAGLSLAPSDPRESAIVATLPPGTYSAIVTGKNNTTGIALVEVYNTQ
jgi:hypothetical protein